MTQAPAPARSRRGRPSIGALFPGDRRIWLTAAALIGVGLLVMLAELVVPRDYYTGTNSIRTRIFVPPSLERGDRLCIRGLDIPAGTGQVELDVSTDLPTLPAMTGSLSTGGRMSPPASVPASPGPRRKVRFDVPERPGSPASVRGDFCVQAEGRVFVGGNLDLKPGDVPATRNGRPDRNRYAVWFRPPEGEQRSLISHFGEILDRASLFRPSFVSPAFYWLLLLVFMPLLAYSALRLLASAPERTTRGLAIAIGLIAFGNAAAWAFVTPSFNSPDESEHFAYVQWFAETGKAVARQGDTSRDVYSADEQIALEATRLLEGVEVRDGKPPWLEVAEERWRERSGGPRAPPRDTGGGSTPATTSHSPAYYALLVPAYHAAAGGSIFDQLTAARLTSALFAAVAAICAFLLVREFVPRHPVPAVAAGLLVGLHPMFAFIAGSVNNDNGVNAAAAVVILLMVRGFLRGLTVKTAVALGVGIAIMPVLKGTGYALYPLLLLALAVLVLRRHTRADLRTYAVFGAAFAATAVLWAVVSTTFDQTAVTTPGGAAPGNSAVSNPLGYLSYLWQVFLPPLPFMADLHVATWPFWDIYIVRGWGAFGWYAVTFPLRVYMAIFAMTIAVGILGLRLLARNRERVRRDWPALAFVFLVPVVVIAAVEAAYFSPTPRALSPEFGRYLFPAITALAAMAAGSCLALGRRWAPVALTALVGATILLNYAAQLLTLSGFYSA